MTWCALQPGSRDTRLCLCRATGQHEYAEELLQRCLYALEMAWPPSFRAQVGGCRVAFEEEQNRPLFVALFRHVQARSCLRLWCHPFRNCILPLVHWKRVPSCLMLLRNC